MGRGAVGTLILALGLAVGPAHASEPAAAVYGPPPTYPGPRPTYPDGMPDQHEDCTDLSRFEPTAMLGKLTPADVVCLEKKYEEDAASRPPVSALLITNAYSKGDTSDWARLLRRHFQDVGTDDPNLTFKYAVYLGKRGAADAEQVIVWADLTLTHRDAWTGDTLTSRVYALHALRAKAGRALWQAAVDAQGVNAVPPEAIASARARMLGLAREWGAVALPAGKAAGQAEQLCAEVGSPGCASP